ncbi:hypothetical protein FOL47_009342, partial [Perkinsus chesapeaki]
TGGSNTGSNEPVVDRMSELKRKLVESRGGLTADLSAMQPSAESAAKIPKVAARGKAAARSPSGVSSPSHEVPKAGVRAPAKVGKQIRVQHPPPAAINTRGGQVHHVVHLAKHKPSTTPAPPPPKAAAHPVRHVRGPSEPRGESGSSEGGNSTALAPPTMPVPLISIGHQTKSTPQPTSPVSVKSLQRTPVRRTDEGKLRELIPSELAEASTRASQPRTAPAAAHNPAAAAATEAPTRGVQSAVSRLRTLEHLRAKKAAQQMKEGESVAVAKAAPVVVPSDPKPTPVIVAKAAPVAAKSEKPAEGAVPPSAAAPKAAEVMKPVSVKDGEQSLTERMVEAVLSQLIETHSQWLADHCGVDRASLRVDDVEVAGMEVKEVDEMLLEETATFETKLKASGRFDRFRDAVTPHINASVVDFNFFRLAQEAGVFETSDVVEECPESLLLALAVFIAEQYPKSLLAGMESYVAHAEDFELTNENYLTLLPYYLLPRMASTEASRVIDGWATWRIGDAVKRLQRIRKILDDFVLAAYSVHEVATYEDMASRATKLELGVPISLAYFEKSVFSQNGEDGVIEAAVAALGDAPQLLMEKPYSVEIGVQSGVQCNTRALRLSRHWRGIMFDKSHFNPYVNLHREFVSPENVNRILRDYSVPTNVAFVSIDIDGNDFYVWLALDYVKPLLVMIEINGYLADMDGVIFYDAEFVNDGTTYYGASLRAMCTVARLKGYSLVWANAVNALFVMEEYSDRFDKAGEYLMLKAAFTV